MKHDMTLIRRSKNKLNPEITKSKLKRIAAVAERNKSYGFKAKVSRLGEPSQDGDQYVYVVRIRLEKQGIRSEDAAQRNLMKVIDSVTKKASAEGWVVEGGATDLGGDEAAVEAVDRPEFQVPILTDEVIYQYFGGIYERDEQIRMMHESVETMVMTNGKITNHQLLHGLWGSCKTVLMERFKLWYDSVFPTSERVAFVDGTTMSKAGLENWLLQLAESGSLPEVLVIDELEKQPNENLSCLNGIMGSGVLAKLNARISNRRESVRMLVVGICNDLEALKKTSLGNALLSRFGEPVYCPRPSRELALAIMTDMISVFPNGNPAWAEAAVAFGWDELGQRDIRKIKKHLSARDRLLDGSYQEDQRRLLMAKEYDEMIRAQELEASQ